MGIPRPCFAVNFVSGGKNGKRCDDIRRKDQLDRRNCCKRELWQIIGSIKRVRHRNLELTPKSAIPSIIQIKSLIAIELRIDSFLFGAEVDYHARIATSANGTAGRVQFIFVSEAVEFGTLQSRATSISLALRL